MKQVTYKEAKKDIEEIIAYFSKDPNVDIISATRDITLRKVKVQAARLEKDSPSVIREIYIDQPWGKDAINVIFPRVVYEVAEQYTAGKIDVPKAKQILRKAHRTYERVLTEKGIDTRDELWEI